MSISAFFFLVATVQVCEGFFCTFFTQINFPIETSVLKTMQEGNTSVDQSSQIFQSILHRLGQLKSQCVSVCACECVCVYVNIHVDFIHSS